MNISQAVTMWETYHTDDVPLHIVSKVILRHANLSATQRYLGKVNDAEAMPWIENLYA